MNKFLGVGRNTKDGELRTTESGINVYVNTLAMTNNFKNKDGKYDSEFINYIAYRNTADFLKKYSNKGTMIAIEGRIHTRSYVDKEKNKKYATEIIVENVSVLERKVESTEQVEDIPQNIKTEYQENEIALEDNDLPF